MMAKPWPNPDELKVCMCCGIEKQMRHFSHSGRKPRYCKACMAAKTANFRARNPDRVAEQLLKSQKKRNARYIADAAYRQKHLDHRKVYYQKLKKHDPKKLKAKHHRNKLITFYKMRPEDYERMLTEQEGQCACCGRIPDKLVIDHDHATGEVRGLLCYACNTGIGLLRDSPSTLDLAKDYLQGIKHVVC